MRIKIPVVFTWQKARKIGLRDQGPIKGKKHEMCGTELRMGDHENPIILIRYAWCPRCILNTGSLDLLGE